MEREERDVMILQTIIRELVEHPEDSYVVRSVDEMGVLLSVHLHPEDMGKVIGRQGITAKSLRAIMRAIGMKNNSRINIKIVEPAGNSRRPEGHDIYAGDIANPRDGAPMTL